MSSCTMKSQDSDEEVDLEALRLAALKSRKPKYPRVNHSNLIPIVPVAVETKDFVNTKIKLEKVSPPRRGETGDVNETNKENLEEKASDFSKVSLENDEDILSMDDKEEEDSLERLMDELEAEISGKAPVSSNRTMLSSKKENKTGRKNDKEGDDEIELVQVKTGKEPSAIIEIRESASPESVSRETNLRKSNSPKTSRDFGRRSRSKLRSRSPFLRGRSYGRSRSPYWSRSPRRSGSPFRRSRSPYWLNRKSRSKSRSPFSRRYRSPPRKRSPFSRFSRSRSISYGRRSPWSISPRRRSKSPFFHDGPPPRRRAFNSPRRSFSPRRRSRSPRPFTRSPFYRRSKSPFRRSRSPVRKTSLGRSESPFRYRSKSPLGKQDSPGRSPMGNKFSKSPPSRSLPKSSEKSSPKPRSKSPGRRYEASWRSPGRSRDGRSVSVSTSPTTRRNRSPLKVVEKNKLEEDEKSEKVRDRSRSERRHKSLSRENNRSHDRRQSRQKYFRRFSPSRSRRSADRQSRRSKSPVSRKRKDASERSKGEMSKPKEKEPTLSPAAPPDPVLEARKKKFETLGEVNPAVDKKINLKPIKESTENPEEDEDVLTLNVDCNLWDESEESADEFESRFKCDGARKNRLGASERTVLSFRNLREGDAANRKDNLSKPLTDDGRREKFKRDRSDAWLQGRGCERNDRRRRPRAEETKDRTEDKNLGGSKRSEKSSSVRPENRSGRKPIVWSEKSERKLETDAKSGEGFVRESDVRESKSKMGERAFSEGREKLRREESSVHETDDFDKLISDFEKELESDLCVMAKEVSSTMGTVKSEAKRTKISLKKDPPESRGEPPVRKPLPKTVSISENALSNVDKSCESNDTPELAEGKEPEEVMDGPEDYIEDDDFFLDVSTTRKQKMKGEEEDSQSDLRAVLSKRRNERLTKAVSLQENMPTRLVQSAFQGLGNKTSNRQMREVQEASEFSLSDKTGGAEGRRVLLLHRGKNPTPSIKCTVPEVKPDTAVHQRFARTSARRKRKLPRQLESVEDLEQEEEEQDGLEVEEEKQFRRFRLKRNVTLSSQLFHKGPIHILKNISSKKNKNLPKPRPKAQYLLKPAEPEQDVT